MPLILAVDRDRRQTTQLGSLVRKRLDAELVQAATAVEGLEALGGRVPDLILTSSLLSPKDDGLLAGHLRDLGQKAAHVQTLTIPLLRASKPGRSKSGVMSKLRRDKKRAPTTDGCDPDVFADEIQLYLARAAEERQTRVARHSASSADTIPSAPPPRSSELVEPPVALAELVEITESAAQADEVGAVAIVEASALVEDAILVDAPVELASFQIPEGDLQTIEPLEAIADEYPATPEFGYEIIEAAADVHAPVALVEPSEAPADTPFEYPQEPVASFDNAAELAAQDAIASAFHELRDVDRAGRDTAYPTSLEEALAAVNATLTALENTPHEAVPGVSASAANANHDSAISPSPELDPLVSVSLDRLVALFADLPHDENRAVVKEPDDAAASSPAPMLDDESLALIGEAARKVMLGANTIKGPAAGKSSSHLRQARSSSNESVEIDLSNEIEAIEPERPKDAEASEVAQAEASESKDARGKKKPRRRSKGPIQDEWGLFDPDQCGFSALVDKLDEVTDPPEEQKPQQGTRVRVISY